MIKFIGGPADGKVLDLRRAPAMLRVVVNKAGEVDALDQLDDTPEAIALKRVRAIVENIDLLEDSLAHLAVSAYLQGVRDIGNALLDREADDSFIGEGI